VDGNETDDFEFLFAGGGSDFDFVADFAVEERFADGGGGGDEAFFDVGFLAADELVLDFDVALGVENSEARAVAGAVRWNIGET
jgi:hypothetical protein